jgi:hypothetical protein
MLDIVIHYSYVWNLSLYTSIPTGQTYRSNCRKKISHLGVWIRSLDNLLHQLSYLQYVISGQNDS